MQTLATAATPGHYSVARSSNYQTKYCLKKSRRLSENFSKNLLQMSFCL